MMAARVHKAFPDDRFTIPEEAGSAEMDTFI